MAGRRNSPEGGTLGCGGRGLRSCPPGPLRTCDAHQGSVAHRHAEYKDQFALVSQQAMPSAREAFRRIVPSRQAGIATIATANSRARGTVRRRSNRPDSRWMRGQLRGDEVGDLPQCSQLRWACWCRRRAAVRRAYASGSFKASPWPGGARDGHRAGGVSRLLRQHGLTVRLGFELTSLRVQAVLESAGIDPRCQRRRGASRDRHNLRQCRGRLVDMR